MQAKAKVLQTVQIPGFLEGKPFKPKVPLELAEAYEAQELAILQQPRVSMVALGKARNEFVRKVLEASVPAGQSVSCQLDSRDVLEAFQAIWAYAFRIQVDEVPLA